MRPKMGGGSKKFLREYFGALVRTPQIFRRIAFRKRTLEEELQEVGVAQERPMHHSDIAVGSSSNSHMRRPRPPPCCCAACRPSCAAPCARRLVALAC